MRTFGWRRHAVAAILSAVVVTVGGGGAALGAPRVALASRAAAPVTLRFATWDTGNLLQYEKQVATLFQKSHPSIQV